ncbi:MAG: zf-HC2 domain-containing protein [Clostridiales bacterium]|nr:zf-HC2 domain-containing protein [Clostridiales bacterium]
MSCNFDDMLLYEYIDKTLDADEKLLVDRHLSACPSCRKKISEIKLLYYELDNLEDISVPEEVDAIRNNIVASAFEDQKISTTEKLKQTKKKLEETPIVGAFIPTKEKMSSAAKGLYKGSKKVYQSIPKKEKEPKKRIRKNFGGLL